MSFSSLNYLNEKWIQDLDDLKSRHLMRSIFPVDEKRQQLNFSSNDYLGLRTEPRVIEAGFVNAQKYGAGGGASRIVLQTDGKIEQLEEFFCAKTGFLKSFFFPSGFVANINFFDALQSSVTENIDLEIFLDHRCHASIYFALQKTNLFVTHFRHQDLNHLDTKLKNSKAKAKLIVLESLYSMDGDLSNGFELSELCRKYEALLFIDESHSIGLYGAIGMGWYENIPNWKDIVLGASFGCGKAVGVSGGFISLNSTALFERIKQRSKMFLFSTSISPFVTGAVSKSLEIIVSTEGEEKREILRNNCCYFVQELKKISFNFPLISERKVFSPIFPLVFGENEIALDVSQFLLNRNIIAKAIRPPTVPKNSARIRVCLSSLHAKNEIDFLIENLREIINK